MSSDLIPFVFESHEIRIITHADGSWAVVAKDLLVALAYAETTLTNIGDAISHVPQEWKGRFPIPTPGGIQDMLTLTEQGLYFFCNRSDKPKAMPLQKWIAGDILPTIRKTGQYTLPGAQPSNETEIVELRLVRAINSTIMALAKSWGTDLPMACALSADAIRERTGRNYTLLLANNVIAEKPMTPTELGKLLKLTPRKTNTALATAGLQERNENEEWVPTEKGRPYSTCNPFKSPHSDHTGYRTLWYRAVLEVLNQT